MLCTDEAMEPEIMQPVLEQSAINEQEQTETCNDGDTATAVLPAAASKCRDDRHLIQITASNAEINRRIAAFKEQKQRDVDKNNCQEFCGVHPSMTEREDSCARSAAVFIPRAGGKSHIKVSRVENLYGPQTRVLTTVGDMSPYRKQTKQDNSVMSGLEERLTNMEEHLNMKPSTKMDVFSRLKNLESRILHLESLSPEYFTTGPPVPKRPKLDSRPKPSSNRLNQELNMFEIDNRIRSLRESLMNKSAQR